MSDQHVPAFPALSTQRPWDARLARVLVEPLKDSWITPNHLTTVRLAAGLGAAAAFAAGTYLWANVGALLLVLSNFLDHTDGELARLSGKTSRIGHLYDLTSDALVTVLLFVGIGVGAAARRQYDLEVSPILLGTSAGVAVSAIFLMRMRIESMHGKSATQQASLGGFETEDILYLLPVIALCNAMLPMLLAAAVCSPLFAVLVAIDYRRMLLRSPR